jgi:hypothetical protein
MPVLEVAGIGEVEALVDPQRQHLRAGDDLVAQDVAEMLGARHLRPTIAMCGRLVRQRKEEREATPATMPASTPRPSVTTIVAAMRREVGLRVGQVRRSAPRSTRPSTATMMVAASVACGRK